MITMKNWTGGQLFLGYRVSICLISRTQITVLMFSFFNEIIKIECEQTQSVLREDLALRYELKKTKVPFGP